MKDRDSFLLKIDRIQGEDRSACMWEKGGSRGRFGYCQLIADKDGDKKVAVYTKVRGGRRNGNHSLVEIEEGDLIVRMERDYDDYTCTVLRVEKIMRENERVRVKREYEYRNGEWSKNQSDWLTESLKEMLNAAMKKVGTKNCKTPFYVIENVNRISFDKTIE